ncbi:tRNA pseudouridine(38-40) synthase TruA [Caenispirillum bisanense]|uniref:tRNA pseudouridine(38-40) synthase TruA n=1 Tax=Caenispirillum bisanense TaxID=414052 RepID=UPI0031D1E129
MPRYKLIIEYDGGPFCGWQRQANGLSVQEAVETAVTRYCQVEAVVHAAGRTDSGVHALGQVAHVDLPRSDPPDKVRDALNAHLRPHPVTVVRAEAVDEDFHARFSARERSYLYRILNRRSPPALDAGRVWWVGAALDAEAMHDAAQALVGHHDFTTFRAKECQSQSPVKTLDEIRVTRVGEEIHLFCRARSFLHHQVRNMTGTLRLVGEGRWSRADVACALAARDRAAGGPTAPPQGLYFLRVDYPTAATTEEHDPCTG